MTQEHTCADGPTSVQFFGDASCPFTWIASRWMSEVADARDIEVRWRTFSIEARDGGELSDSIPEHLREVAMAARVYSRRAARVFEAVRERHGEAAVGALYTAAGQRLFVTWPPGVPPPTVLTEALEAAGLPADLEEEAESPSWDAAIERSIREAYEVVGDEAMSPTLVIESPVRVGMAGPVLSAAPTGKEALEIWDAMVRLAQDPGFIGIRMPRTTPPRFAEPPEADAAAHGAMAEVAE